MNHPSFQRTTPEYKQKVIEALKAVSAGIL
jgi:hypothetical protein